MSNNLDLDQEGCSVSPDLGPNCFQLLTLPKNSCRNTFRVSNGLEQDQNGCIVSPGLGPYCLQRLSRVFSQHFGNKNGNLHWFKKLGKITPYNIIK